MKKILTFFILLFAIFSISCSKEKNEDPATLTLSVTGTLVFENDETVKTVTVNTNKKMWTVVSDKEDWCKVKKLDDKSFEVSVIKNDLKEERTGATITVTAGTGSLALVKTFQVSHKGIPTTSFALTIENITSGSADVSVVPSNKDVLYYYDVLAVDILNENHEGKLDVYMKNMIAEGISRFETVEALLEKITAKGDSKYTFAKLSPSKEYYAFAVELDAKGNMTSPIESTKFTTAEIEDKVKFDVEITNTYFDGADFTVTPSDESLPFYTTIRPYAAYKDKSDKELLQAILEEDSFMLDVYTAPGVYEYENEGVWCTDTEYFILIFGYANGEATTNLTKSTFRTLKSKTDPKDCTFNIETPKVTSRSMDVKITPSDDMVMFMFDILDESEYNKNKSNMASYVKEYIAYNESNMDTDRYRGEAGYNYTKVLTPSTNYYVWVACIDEYGNVQGNVHVSKPIKTLENKISEATVTVEYKCFNGDDLFAKDPEKYKDCKGFAAVQVSYSATKASIWYGTLVEDDVENPIKNMSDSEIVDILVRAGTWCVVKKLYISKWDTPHAILAVGIGEDDNNGKLVRIYDTFKKDNVSPISEFDDGSASSASVSVNAVVTNSKPSVKVYKTKK